MKTYFVFTAAALLVLSISSCKKETVTEQTTTVNTDGSTTTTTKTTTDYDLLRLKKAEDDYNAAEREVVVAREKGDTEAERVAREAADKAKLAWERTKEELREGAGKAKEAINDVRDDIRTRRTDRDTVVVK